MAHDQTADTLANLRIREEVLKKKLEKHKTNAEIVERSGGHLKEVQKEIAKLEKEAKAKTGK